MIIFFLLATVFTCFTLWALVSVWKRRQITTEDTNNAEWQVLLAKRNEIESDVLLPQQTRDDLRREWTGMADAVLAHGAGSAGKASAADTPRHHWWLAAGSGLIALALYALVGRWDGDALLRVTPEMAQSPARQQDLPMADGARHPGGTETIEDRIAKLEKKLLAAPDDLEGWVLLSRSRGIQRDFAGATAALEKALALAPGHPDILADLADVTAMTNNKSLAGRPMQLIEQALQSAPGHRKALSLAATAAMQENNIKLATQYWLRLRATFPAGAPDIAQVDTILASLGAAPGATPPAAAPAAPATTTTAAGQADAASIAGAVELSPAMVAALKKQPLPASAILFVVAKAISGPPMPLAVVRLPVQQLLEGKAVAFKLDDSQAMTPATKLSGSARVNLEARISLAGTAGKQPGDLFIAMPDVATGSANVRLLIQSVVP